MVTPETVIFAFLRFSYNYHDIYELYDNAAGLGWMIAAFPFTRFSQSFENDQSL
jgi:hypothetical protein